MVEFGSGRERRVRRSRWVATAVLLALVGIAAVPAWNRAALQRPLAGVDEGARAYLTDATSKALSVYATCRLFNAVVSAVQGSTVQGAPAGVGVTVALGEVLDPLNDLVERFSAVMLYSLSALATLQVLARIGTWLGFAVLLPIALVALLPAAWGAGTWRRGWGVTGVRLLILAAVVRFAVPAAAGVDAQLSALFLDRIYGEAAARLHQQEPDESTSAGEPGEGLYGRFKVLVEEARAVPERVERLRLLAGQIVEQVVALIAVFILHTALIPLAILYGLVKTVRLAFGATTGERVERWLEGVAGSARRPEETGRKV